MSALDLTDVLARLDRLVRLVDAGAEDGLDTAAGTVQQAMQDTTAHGDMSGATRASYRAIPIGPGRDGAAAAASGYAAAAQALAGYAGHGGQPLQQESGVHLADGERGMLLTSFTDYQDALETEHAGAKAVLGPTLQAEAQTITATVAGAIRELL